MIEFLFEDEPTYHGRAGEYLTSSLLKSFDRSPMLYYKLVNGLVEKKSPTNDAFLLGSAVHCRFLEPLEYRTRYKVLELDGPINEKTGEPYGIRTKAHESWASQLPEGTQVLTSSQADLVKAMSDSLWSVETLPVGEVEAVLRCDDVMGLPGQCKFDHIRITSDEIIVHDVKTCQDIDWFEQDAKKYKYDIQLGWYYLVLKHCGYDLPVTWFWHVVEKQEPFRAGLWECAPSAIYHAKKRVADLVDHVMECMENDYWPTGYEEPRQYRGWCQ